MNIPLVKPKTFSVQAAISMNISISILSLCLNISSLSKSILQYIKLNGIYTSFTPQKIPGNTLVHKYTSKSKAQGQIRFYKGYEEVYQLTMCMTLFPNVSQ